MQSKHCNAWHACSRSFVAITILSLLLWASSFNRLTAQAAPKPVYVAVNYVKVNPGMGSQYNNLLSTYIKKINEEHLKAGRIMGWYVHNVMYPTGSSAKYDMTIVTVSNDISLLIEDPEGFRGRMKSILPGATDQTLDAILNSIGESRTLVKREIFTYLDGVNINSAPSRYVQVDFMKTTPGKASDYVKMEKEIFKPMHAEFVKQSKKDDWGLYDLSIPYSETGEYDFITANFFTSVNQMTSGNYDEVFKKLFPKLDPTATWNQMSGLRKMVRSEIWKLGVFVDATTTK
jgi:hypothetical protein